MSRPHALVVGASSGLGAAIARRLKQTDHAVSGFARRPSAEADVDVSFECDVTDRKALAASIAASFERLGPPELLVYAAGLPAMGKTLEVSAVAARAAFEVNFWGLDNAVHAVLPAMAARRRGTILGLSSIAALRPIPHEAYYAASKAAATRYLGCLAHEASKEGVRVKVLNIGYIDTGFAEKTAWFGMRTPERRASAVTADDVATAALELLASHRMSKTLGWRENTVAIADRLFPELYDRWLRLRR